MLVMMKNLTPRPFYVQLHCGENLRLQPGRFSRAVDEVEVKGNTRIDKLLSQRFLTLESAPASPEDQAVVSTGTDDTKKAAEGTTHAPVAESKTESLEDAEIDEAALAEDVEAPTQPLEP